MWTVDSRPIGSERERKSESGRHNVKALFCTLVVIAVFVVAVITMALRDGTNAAVMTALLVVAVAGIAVGLWGTAMAVKETEEFRSPPDE
jgi:undecaprenyl pyrophosphate phosphatase UppP